MAKTTTKAAPPNKPKEEMTCFVVIGFGTKTDYATGRVLNLDKTYTQLIKPAFDEVGVRCFRAIDVNRSGSIDKIMYYWIYHADFVVADLSTMNANVFYELGVRHAQKPGTTLLIAENELLKKIPFDLGHTVIHAYEHLGDDIAPKEVERFVGHLSTMVESLIENPVDQDSPVFTYMPGMQAPVYVDQEKLIEQLQAQLEQEADGDPEKVMQQSLAILLDRAEQAKDAGDYATAKAFFQAALDHNPTDVFLHQRLALVTYKAKEKSEDDAEAIAALDEAEEILAYCKPDISTDPETLGLSGAIYKRRYERTGRVAFFDKAMYYYERGFYIKQDYYNGINAAYLHTVKAARLAEDDVEAIVHYGHANIIRQKIADLCNGLIGAEGFEDRGDKQWIYQTLMQAYLGMEQREKAERLVPKVKAFSKGTFDMDTFLKQNQDLLDAIETFKQRVRLPGTSDGAATPDEPPPSVAAEEAQAPEVALPESAPAAETRPVVRRTAEGAISLDLGPLADAPIKAVEVNFRVEYE